MSGVVGRGSYWPGGYWHVTLFAVSSFLCLSVSLSLSMNRFVSKFRFQCHTRIILSFWIKIIRLYLWPGAQLDPNNRRPDGLLFSTFNDCRPTPRCSRISENLLRSKIRFQRHYTGDIIFPSSPSTFLDNLRYSFSHYILYSASTPLLLASPSSNPKRWACHTTLKKIIMIMSFFELGRRISSKLIP